jgi:hypothetical protein
MPAHWFDKLLFDGAPELVKHLERLWRRPWWYGRERSLPIIYLQVPDSTWNPLRGMKKRLEEPRYRRLHYAFIDERPAPVVSAKSALARRKGADAVEAMEKLLREAVAQLADRRRGTSRLKFPRFALATWLLRLEIDPQTQPNVGREVANRFEEFRRQHRPQLPKDGPEVELVASLPLWVKLPWFATVLTMRIISASWSAPRWFAARSPYAHDNSSFYELARDFATTPANRRDADQVCHMLVEAFLTDLSSAYRRAGVLGTGRRRTTYPILFMTRSAEDRTRHRLLELIGEIRTAWAMRAQGHTFGREQDPLLVIGSGGTMPYGSPAHGAVSDQPSGTRGLLEDWSQELVRRGLGDRARWFLRVVLDEKDGPRHQAGIRQTLRDLPMPRVRRPWMTYVSSGALVLGLFAVPVVNHERCQTLWSLPSLRSGMTREALAAGRDQCVGLLPAGAPLPDQVADVVKIINDTNKDVVRDPQHLTVVHFSMLTPGNEQGERAAREELRGLAVAQKETLADQHPIRILLANAGSGMRYAETAAAKVVDEARRDQRIIGVVGLGLSTEATGDAIRRLAKGGLASVGSATTADQLALVSNFYFQVSPSNRREAQVAAAYAVGKRYRSVRIYYSGDRTDIYSGSLAEAMRREFTARKILIREFIPYGSPPSGSQVDVGLLGAQACAANENTDELVVYAGRAERFNAFLNGMKLSCQNAYPPILASDDVSRFVLEGQTKNYPGLKLEYMALASSALWGTTCKAAARQSGFYPRYNDLFGGSGSTCDESRDGRALLSYDALGVLRRAVANAVQTGSNPPTAPAIPGGLGDIRGRGRVTGASGDIDYSGQEFRRVPVDKAILILRATEGQPCLVQARGRFSSQERIKSDCPTARGLGGRAGEQNGIATGAASRGRG